MIHFQLLIFCGFNVTSPPTTLVASSITHLTLWLTFAVNSSKLKKNYYNGHLSHHNQLSFTCYLQNISARLVSWDLNYFIKSRFVEFICISRCSLLLLFTNTLCDLNLFFKYYLSFTRALKHIHLDTYHLPHASRKERGTRQEIAFA